MVHQLILQSEHFPQTNRDDILKQFHSELTISKFKFHDQTVKVIDFGLLFVSIRIEDKTVNLDRVFKSAHLGKGELFDVILVVYGKTLFQVEQWRVKLKKVLTKGRERSLECGRLIATLVVSAIFSCVECLGILMNVR
jgi:hypothetical protein